MMFQPCLLAVETKERISTSTLQRSEAAGDFSTREFKWNLRIRHFHGTSENAVKTQIWTAVCVYVLAAIVKKELALDVALYTFPQILSLHSFEKTPFCRRFRKAIPALPTARNRG
jgi:hypothetical protein